MEEGQEVATSLLAKLRRFVSTELDDEECEMFAALLAPGVALAYEEQPYPEGRSDEVVVFGASASGPDDGRDKSPLSSIDTGADVQWHAGALARALAGAIRESGLRVVGLE